MTERNEGSAESGEHHAQVPEEHRATEYLANERTFLAWIRTSIAVISIGFALTRLRLESSIMSISLRQGASGASLDMGIALMAFGALLAILAVYRYQKVNRAIHQGRVKADHGLIYLVTALVVFLAGGAIVYTALLER